LISEYLFDGKPVIQNKVRFNFWRAMTDNDIGWKVNQKMQVWENEAGQVQLKSLTVEANDENEIVLKSNCLFPNTNSTAEIRHTIYPDGKIRIGFEMEIPEKAPRLPRVGLQFEINRALQQIDWFGRGPQENYADRKTGAAFGIYQSTLDKFVTPYIRPQENANRCDVRWIRFSNEDKQQVQFTAEKGSSFSASAWPYSQQTLIKAAHGFELSPGLHTVVNIDCAQMGVGGDNSWGLPVLEQYQLKPGKYQYNFFIQAK
jgi:beta-galactosidase